MTKHIFILRSLSENTSLRFAPRSISTAHILVCVKQVVVLDSRDGSR